MTTEGLDLQTLLQKPLDTYLIYWLAHLTPLYYASNDIVNSLYKANDRMKHYLPSFPMRTVIDLKQKVISGDNHRKSFWEKFF